MPATAKRTLVLSLILAPALAAGACNRQSSDSEGTYTADSIPRNQGMSQGGPGVGDNAPGGSAGATTGPSAAGPTSTPGGAADYPATGKP